MGSDFAKIAVLAVIAAGLCLSLYRLVRVRRDPTLRERRRRAEVYRTGRLAEGTVLDVDDQCVYYQYAVNGVPYSTAQDLSTLGSVLPADRNSLIGEVRVKFAQNNPVNSIVACEYWTGFKTGQPKI